MIVFAHLMPLLRADGWLAAGRDALRLEPGIVADAIGGLLGHGVKTGQTVGMTDVGGAVAVGTGHRLGSKRLFGGLRYMEGRHIRKDRVEGGLGRAGCIGRIGGVGTV